ncbi:phage distal tail protein [Mammaliicoccus vitulinus]|uniref:Phage tail family protein n=1 Tax=Mammaliicoccus vitulinus TaxID=71237 RepID=A0ABX7HIQ1_9STAP|nr:phage tail protein [Mammaliicoccus vitulinus]QRO86413.1 phage tail family protein [Mammaliicoccus vitulinus]
MHIKEVFIIETIIVNGKKLPWLEVERGFNIPSFNFVTEREKINGRPGSVKKSRQLDEYEIEIPILVRNDYLSDGGIKDHDEISQEIIKFVNYDEPITFRFSSQSWYWNVQIDGPIEIPLNTEGQIIQFTLKIILTDPYKYSTNEYTNTAISDEVAIVNKGTADTPIVIEARAIKDSTNFMIAKGKDGVAEDYFMIGKSEDANKVNKDEEPILFNDEFHTGIGNWAYVAANTSFGNKLDGGDANGGRFGVSELKDSIYPSNYGTTISTNWHGAAIYKSLGKSLGDLRVKFKVLVRHHADTGPGKGFTYILDEKNRTLFSIGYVNTSTSRNFGQIIAYAYNEHGEAQRIYTRETPFKYLKIDNMHVFMTLERKGNEIYIETCKYDYAKDKGRRKPLDKHSRTYTDSGNFYQRKVRISQMYVGKSAKYEKRLYVNILGYSIQELLPKQSDVTPIVIRTGDLIVIDTGQNLVTLNDESVLKMKDFGSNYFNIDSGSSELVIDPQGKFDTKIIWRDRFL